MKKLIARIGLTAAATLGMAGLTAAVYPPDGTGIVGTSAECTFDTDGGEVTDWAVEVNYTAVSPATLTIENSASEAVVTLQVLAGTGNLSVTPDTGPGLGTGQFRVHLEADGTTVTAVSAGCVTIPDRDSDNPTESTDGPEVLVPTSNDGAVGNGSMPSPVTGVDLTTTALLAGAVVLVGVALLWAARSSRRADT